MSIFKKIMKYLHNKESFKRHGLKQISTWIGVIVFICLFDNDLLTLVHNVLTDANLSEKIAAGLGGFVLIMFNKKENK